MAANNKSDCRDQEWAHDSTARSAIKAMTSAVIVQILRITLALIASTLWVCTRLVARIGPARLVVSGHRINRSEREATQQYARLRAGRGAGSQATNGAALTHNPSCMRWPQRHAGPSLG